MCFAFIVLSCVQIFRTVLRMPSEQGRHKAFSMCLPHLAMLSLFVTTCMFAYLKPPSISSQSLDLVVSFLYSVVPPAVNPLICGMRNLDLKDTLGKLMSWTVFIKNKLLISLQMTHRLSQCRPVLLIYVYNIYFIIIIIIICCCYMFVNGPFAVTVIF